jgi:hypothetical protein
MTVTSDQRHRPEELFKRLGPDMYREAYRRGMSMSAFLEHEDPSTNYPESRLDAFERLLQVSKIRTRSDAARGIYADKFEAFLQSDQHRALGLEWMMRQYRRAATGRDVNTRAMHTLADFAVGGIQRPYADDATLRAELQIAPAIPLSELVAREEGIQGKDYRSIYLSNGSAAATDEYRMKRVPEGTDIPRAKLVESENVIRLRKYGRALEATYDMLRGMRLDKVAFHIALMAVQAEVDKVAAALDVLVNGDGNGNAAVEFELAGANGLDSGATAGTLTLKGWQRFKKKFKNPYVLTTTLMQEEASLQVELLTVSNGNVQLVNGALGQLQRINQFADGVRYGWLDEAPALKIVGFDRRMALESISEIGAMISEVDKFISNQTELITFTEVQGFAILDKNATKILDINGTQA